MSLASTEARNRALASNYGDNRGADWPATLDVALYLGRPSAGGVEVSGGDYAAVNVANTSATWDPPAAGSITMTATLDFGDSSTWDTDADWLAIRDPAGDVLLEELALADDVVSGASGGPATVPGGSIVITEPGE